MKKISLSLVLSLISFLCLFAQSDTVTTVMTQAYQVEMATGLRSSGKIWVVVSVLLTLVIGIYIFLFIIDKKVKNLENK